MKVFFFIFGLMLFSAEVYGNRVRNRLQEESMINGTLFQGHIFESNGNGLARCGTTATESDVHAIQAAQAPGKFKDFKQSAFNFIRKWGSGGRRPFPVHRNKIIPVCFHVVGRRISRWQLNKDLVALNKAFSGHSCCDPSESWCVPGTCSPDTGIRFKMGRLIFRKIRGTTKSPNRLFACVTRYPSDVDMSDDNAAKEVKKAKHVGDAQILNVYFSTLGGNSSYATFPTSLNSDEKYLDGVVINRRTKVGGDLEHYNEGDALAHAVGHWLGLYHTFEWGCLPAYGISDIPPEREPNYGCNPSEKRDTCPQAGLDPIHNFMDESYDICLYEWTKGQIDVMHAVIDFYRSGRTPDMNPVQLKDKVWTERYSMAEGTVRIYYMDVPTSAIVLCQTTADNGDADLFVNSVDDFDTPECISNYYTSNENCYINTNTGKVYVSVYGYLSTIDFQVRCSITIRNPDLTAGTGISMDAGTLTVVFLPDVVRPYSRAACSTVGKGDVDIAVYYYERYDTGAWYGCSSAVPGSSSENCVDYFSGPSYTQVVVYIYASMGSNIDLTCSVTPPTKLTSGVASDHNILTEEDVMLFYMEVDTLSAVTCMTNADNGDLNLFVSWGDFQNNLLWCVSQVEDSELSIETCSPGSAIGQVYGFAYAYGAAVSHFTVKCTLSSTSHSPKALTNGTKTTETTVEAGKLYYFSLNTTNAGDVECWVETQGFVLLFLSSAAGNSCSSQNLFQTDKCSIKTMGKAAYAIIYVNATALGGFSITCYGR